MMDDDDKEGLALLKQLGARAREQAKEPAAPIPALDADARDRISGRLLERVRDSLAHDLRARAIEPARVVAEPPADPANARTKANVTKKEKATVHPLRWMAAAAPLAAAAALVLFVTTRGSSIAAPPAYDMSLVSVTGTRDPASAKISATDFLLDPAGELELLARPVAPVKDAHARAFIVHSGDAKPWLVPLQISDEGAVRITGMTRVLFPTTIEPYDVVIFVAASDVLPSDDEARRIALGADPAASAKYRVIRGHVRFVEKK